MKRVVIGSLIVLFFCTTGGAILTALGLSVGWMIGSLLVSVLLFNSDKLMDKVGFLREESMKSWLKVGQLILGLELGLQLNLSILVTFKNNIIPIVSAIILSILFSLVSGLLLYKFCKIDKLTSFYSTAPGGLSAMPGMAHEAGANTGVVTVLQTMRILLVVISIPIFITLSQNSFDNFGVPTNSYEVDLNQGEENLIWTIVLLIIALGGIALGKKLKFPVPWLIGSMIAVASIRILSSLSLGYEVVALWPQEIMVLSQIMIGASVGSMFKKEMFSGIRKVVFFSFFSTLGLIFIMMSCAYIISILTNISFITTALAFAPGGVAEMTTASVSLQADALFVVSVQVLRVIIVNLTLPPLFAFLDRMDFKNVNMHPLKKDRN